MIRHRPPPSLHCLTSLGILEPRDLGCSTPQVDEDDLQGSGTDENVNLLEALTNARSIKVRGVATLSQLDSLLEVFGTRLESIWMEAQSLACLVNHDCFVRTPLY